MPKQHACEHVQDFERCLPQQGMRAFGFGMGNAEGMAMLLRRPPALAGRKGDTLTAVFYILLRQVIATSQTLTIERRSVFQNAWYPAARGWAAPYTSNMC